MVMGLVMGAPDFAIDTAVGAVDAAGGAVDMATDLLPI
jgi:hypothetical protein